MVVRAGVRCEGEGCGVRVRAGCGVRVRAGVQCEGEGWGAG